MFKARVLVAGISLAAASAAYAGVSATPAVTSDYDFRGISQTAVQPAAQLGVDYSGGPIHVGTWLSTIEWGPSYKGSVEVDVMADYSFGSDDTAKFNVGIIDYMYPDMTDQNTIEPWVTVAKGMFSGSVRYSNDWFGLGHAWYFEGNVAYPIGKSGYTLTGHVGNSSGDAWKHIEYTDYSLALSKGFGNFTGTIKVVSSDADELTSYQSLLAFGKRDVFKTGTRAIISVSTTLPWAK